MNRTVMIAAVVAGLCTAWNVRSQDPDDTATNSAPDVSVDFGDTEESPVRRRKLEADPAPAGSEKQPVAEWKPNFTLVLTSTVVPVQPTPRPTFDQDEFGAAEPAVQQTTRVPVTVRRPVTSHVIRNGRRQQVTRYVQETMYRDVAAGQIGVLRVECDDVELSARTGEKDTVEYSFTSSGPFRVVTGSTRIEGENLKYENGQLVFENAEITTAESVMRTKQGELIFDVAGVQVHRWAEPLQPPQLEGGGFDRGFDDDSRTFNTPSDSNARPRNLQPEPDSGFRRSSQEPTPRSSGDFESDFSTF